MKRYIAVILSLILVVSMMPVGAVAAEDTSERDELIARACEAFPEYANKICNPAPLCNTNSRSVSARELVVSETRSISDNTYVVYTEYTDGIILLTDYEFEYVTTHNSSEAISEGNKYNVDIKATCTNVSGYFKIEGLEYHIFNSRYDAITDVGTTSRSGNCTFGGISYTNMDETATEDARVICNLTFQFGPGGYYSFNSVLSVIVGDNKLTVTHVDFNDSM